MLPCAAGTARSATAASRCVVGGMAPNNMSKAARHSVGVIVWNGFAPASASDCRKPMFWSVSGISSPSTQAMLLSQTSQPRNRVRR
jgi:hypothetical protein